jgi:hypothetical protein
MTTNENQEQERRGMKTSPLWIAIFVILAIFSYLKGPKGIAPNPYKGLSDKGFLAVVLLKEAGHDPWLSGEAEAPQLLIDRFKNKEAGAHERGAAALRLALLKATILEKDFAALAFDKKADPYLRVACFYALSLLEATDHVNALEELYWSEKNDEIRKGVLFAFHIYGEAGQMPIVNVVTRERKLDRKERFYDFNLKEKSAELTGRLKTAVEKRMTDEANTAFWLRLGAIPFVAGIGTLGAAYPPALLLLIPFIWFLLTGKMGAYLFLILITLSNIDETLTVEAIACSISTIIIVFFADQSTFVVDVVILVLALVINFRYQLTNKITSMGQTVVKLATVNSDSIIADICQGGVAREKAMKALITRGPEFVDGLIAADKGDDLSRRATALQALGFVQDDRCAPHLIKALDYPETYLKGTAMYALARLASKEALPKLEKLASSGEDEDLRLNAMKAIAHYAPETAKPMLEKYQNDENTKISIMVRDLIANPPQFAKIDIEESQAQEAQLAEEESDESQ